MNATLELNQLVTFARTHERAQIMARATEGLDIARAIVRARPQDMGMTSCFTVR